MILWWTFRVSFNNHLATVFSLYVNLLSFKPGWSHFNFISGIIICHQIWLPLLWIEIRGWFHKNLQILLTQMMVDRSFLVILFQSCFWWTRLQTKMAATAEPNLTVWVFLSGTTGLEPKFGGIVTRWTPIKIKSSDTKC